MKTQGNRPWGNITREVMGYAAVKWRILPVATTQKADHDFLAKIVQIIPASHISSNLNI
jgi:hypothetical protein